MAVDALDPGPDGDYPYFPRDAQGRPLWSDTGPVPEGGTVMPRGIQAMRDPTNRGRVVFVDVTPRLPDGLLIDPPPIPPKKATPT
ncbi:hypothetical protein HHL19_11435 [Streptomyces sp. R302]|uniref:hypothetical protein n=1 Tax=unclassified Streptomyces TaxID=2593676 RepID=UPI00145D98FB|nr:MULTISPECIES: hypothetical protein [unclassified Streptomyces]NML50275.1 hypothetical protein [Streptomyces sp. R301]NML79266.1 hypothetical protein [Streptomyces sp. R302]